MTTKPKGSDKTDPALVNGTLVPTEEPASIDFSADEGSGMEGAGVEAFAIPFLGALQKLSPQCDEADAKYIAKAKAGQLVNTVTGQIWDGKTGVLFLPVAYQRRFLRWGPRGAANSGFKGEVMPETVLGLVASGTVVELEGRLYYPLPDGVVNEKKCERLAEVRNHFGLLIDEATQAHYPVLLVLSSTQIKKSKLLMSLLSGVKVPAGGRMVTPPTWANKVRVTTVAEQNDKGSWYGYRFALEGLVTNADQYKAAKAFHEAVLAGTGGTVNYADMDDKQPSEVPEGQF